MAIGIGIGEESRTGPAPATGWAAIRPLVLRLHFYAGVFVGPFLLVAALTGIAYVWTPQLEQAVYSHELHVPAAAGALPLDRQVLVARGRVPDGKIIGLRPAPSATDTTQVIFDRPGLAPSYRYTVFVNPHDGEVRGALETYGSGQALPVRGWIDTLHRNLHLGDFGRLYSELAASWLWVITLAGAALWLGRRRRLRAVLLPSAGKPGRARLRSWHGSTGLWIAAGLLFLSATGLTWSLHAGANITDLRSSLDWTTPSVPAGAPSPGDVGWQAVRDATARAGLSDPVEIRPPSDGGYVVQQVGRGWPSRQDSMAVDPGTGKITGTLRFADYPLAAKLSRWGIDAHMGLLFGVANQVVLTVLGVALTGVVAWGYRMWWLRGRPGRSSGGRGRLRAESGRLPGSVEWVRWRGGRGRSAGRAGWVRLRGRSESGRSPERTGSVRDEGRAESLLMGGEAGGVGLPSGRLSTSGAASGPMPLEGARLRDSGKSPDGRGRFGRMPVRGAWRRIPGRVLAPVLVGVAAVGWFLPVFGVSLLGFLAVDCLLGLRRAAAR
ncbi:PepSY-associated TM helix domain-containing protein [Amycolatopsis orientalis]|uniref:PepSY-associated TM helix domain-containing protein n=1 Tax=Amycolatopsis orientalis TaxID=31958 RepID=UPI0003A013CC|nr:PepSY-associated TM helix domain-containing protein [Amycolatopsis orientalis]